jgi:hypothetical protein
MEVPWTAPVPDPLGLCQLYGESRDGFASVVVGAFQRLGVSPDGSAVVFEVTTDVAVFPLASVPAEQQGFYLVRADGSGLRRLGPASREAAFRLYPAPGSPAGFGFVISSRVAYSPDGRTIAFTDLGPGPAGEDFIQIVTLDLVSGRRTQVTHLQSASPPVPGFPATGGGPRFLTNETISFFTVANPDGLNPAGDFVAFSVKTDGTGLRKLPAPVVVPGSRVVPIFQVTGGGANRAPLTLSLPGSPVNPNPFLAAIQEVFLLDGKNLLQLTNFRRADTNARLLSANGQRVFFVASADPLGANPTENCQLFSIDTLGAHLRQVTHFREGDQAVNGCFAGPPPGCYLGNLFVLQDPVTRTIVFDSSCDPLGTNPYGGQLFAMRPDGSGLRQLTATRGFTTDADGAVTVELPGPFAYSAR